MALMPRDDDGWTLPMDDASGGMTDASMYDPSMDGSGMASGPSCFTIEFNDGSYLKEGQTVFVSYDGGGGLVDSNENSINSFSQIVNNSSTVYNDETAPTLMASPMPSLNADGQTISLQFSESIDQSSVYNALQNFKLFVDGVEQTGSFSLESDASGGTTDASMYDPSMDGSGMTDGSGNSSSSSFTLRFNGTTIESGQSVLLSYANTNTDYTDSGITDLAGNDLASFAFQLDNCRVRTSQLLNLEMTLLTVTSSVLMFGVDPPTSVITTQPQDPLLAALILLASKTPSPSMSMVATSTLPTTPSRKTETLPFASTLRTKIPAFTKARPSQSGTTKASSKKMTESSTSAETLSE